MFEYLNGFMTLNTEISEQELKIIGKIPSWLQGSLIRNGPAKFEAGTEKLNHWFDGYAMLNKFKINNGKIYYSNRFIQSQAYQTAIKEQRISLMEFATNPKIDFREKFLRLLNPKLTDNTNVNVTMLDGKHLALTETCNYIHYDLEKLETLGHFKYQDDLAGYLTTAHPHYDYKRQEIYNFIIDFKTSHYIFYKLNKNSSARQIIARIKFKQASYMHSFAMTENYLILIEPPLYCSLMRMIFLQKPFIENYCWKPQHGTRISVIDKSNGRIILQDQTDSFFMFHQINAFEAGQNIYIDLPIFQDHTIISALYLKNLATDAIPMTMPSLKRIELDLSHKKINSNSLANYSLEFPRINYHEHNTMDYRYVYGANKEESASFFNQLVKLDLKKNSCKIWQEAHCYPGEPVFVKNRSTADEDDGAILAVILAPKNNSSFLLILDAQSFTEIARCSLPFCVPFGFHGQFYRDVK